MSTRILLVDDDEAIRASMADFFEATGYAVATASALEEARTTVTSWRPDAVVVDYMLKDGTALDWIPELREREPDLPLVVLTAHGSIDLAVRAVKEGADQFLAKPVELKALRVVIDRLVDAARALRARTLEASRSERSAPNPFVGTSAVIRRLAEQAERIAESDSTVLILGETGSGKGVLARWIHDRSGRGEQAFVDLNGAGLSRELLESELFGHERGAFTGAVQRKQGLLELAHRGTLFLDEVGDIDPDVQPKLLKVIEQRQYRRLGDVNDRRVDVRLILATHRDLAARVAEGAFRSDLYYRVSAIRLQLPSLRERREDILPLAEELKRGLCRELHGCTRVDFSASAVRALEAYDWPGNIRELRNVIERALLLRRNEREIDDSDLSFDGHTRPALPSDEGGMTLADVERRHVERVLREARGRVTTAAQILGIARSSLYEKMRRYGIRPDEI